LKLHVTSLRYFAKRPRRRIVSDSLRNGRCVWMFIERKPRDLKSHAGILIVSSCLRQRGVTFCNATHVAMYVKRGTHDVNDVATQEQGLVK